MAENFKLGRNDVYSDYKELKFWVRLKGSLFLRYMYILHIGKHQEDPRGQPRFTNCSNLLIIIKYSFVFSA